MRTYLDTSVVLAAIKGEPALSKKAFDVLHDRGRVMVACTALHLELLPYAMNQHDRSQLATVNTVLGMVEKLPLDQAVLDSALKLACDHCMGCMDAIHAASSIQDNTPEFLTTEKEPTGNDLGKPFYRIPGLNAKHISRADCPV